MASKKGAGAKRENHGDGTYAELLKETEAVKRLLLLLFIKLGVPSKELGIALGLDGSRVRRMIPSSKIKEWFDSTGKK